MRLRSSSTSPPISPTPSLTFGGQQHQPHGMRLAIDTTIPPELSLELRVRWLEALVHGVQNDRKKIKRKQDDEDASGSEGEVEERRKKQNPEGIGERGETIARKLEEIQSNLNAIVEQNESMKIFLQYYDSSNSRYLTPSFALNDPDRPNAEAPTVATMSPSEFEAYLKDMEPEIRQAERELREIDALEKRGVSAAGNLGAHEELQPRLDALLATHVQNARKAANLETRIASLMDRYTYKTDTLSELFVEWHHVLLGVEEKVRDLERQKAEREKFGYS